MVLCEYDKISKLPRLLGLFPKCVILLHLIELSYFLLLSSPTKRAKVQALSPQTGPLHKSIQNSLTTHMILDSSYFLCILIVVTWLNLPSNPVDQPRIRTANPEAVDARLFPHCGSIYSRTSSIRTMMRPINVRMKDFS